MLKTTVIHGRLKGAFSLVEVLVALAIMTVLAAVLIPGFSAKLRDSRTSTISQTLNGIALGAAEYKKALGRYPGQLTLLTANPTANVARDLCGTFLSSTNTILWRGPYISRDIPAAGIPMGDGFIYAGVRRFPTTVTSTPPTVAYLLIDVGGVETETASDLDIELDGASSTLTGTIRYTSGGIAAQSGVGVNPTNAIPTPTAGTVNLTYAIPINPIGC